MRPDNPLTNTYLDRYPEEAARTLEGVPAAMAADFVAAVDAPRAGRLLEAMVPPTAASLLMTIPSATAAAALATLSTATAERLLRRLPAAAAERLLGVADARTGRRLRRLLRVRPGVVGAVAEPTPFLLPDDIVVAEAVRRVRGVGNPGCEIYVVDRADRPAGWVDPGRLLRARGSTPLRELLEHDVAAFDFHTSLRGAVDHRAWDRVRSAPVVDGEGRVVGLVRYADLQAVARDQRGGMAVPPAEQGLAVAELVWLGLAGALTTLLAGTDGRRKGDGG